MAFAKSVQGMAQYTSNGDVTAFESHKAVLVWIAVPVALALATQFISKLIAIFLVILMVPYALFMPVTVGFWSINQIMVIATTPGSQMWGKLHPNLHNGYAHSVLGFFLLPILLLVIYPIYLIRSIVHVIKVLALRAKGDKRGKYFEFGRRRYWFRQLREAKRRNLQGDELKKFILGSSLGVSIRKEDLNNHYYNSNNGTFNDRKYQDYYWEMVSKYGTPKL
ncbi:hypothetical protein EZI54_07275 [Marinobacter halodurans]|uniref:Uncharacterized protein n=1 Tax=Marinobacter halodurans TaxID=2528979 RepID=A0ABY1ZMB8_9GAMM|nr:hypothetical protein [Marinobacter halodurans]TBW57453.1 hypothetical protein EZI54_07275 [Marinobacter halodurans]